MLKRGTHFRFGSIKTMLTLFHIKGLILRFLNLLHKSANVSIARWYVLWLGGCPKGSNPRLHENKSPLLCDCLSWAASFQGLLLTLQFKEISLGGDRGSNILISIREFYIVCGERVVT
jgi:hypothetical protein